MSNRGFSRHAHLERELKRHAGTGHTLTMQYLRDLPNARWVQRVIVNTVGTWEYREDGKGREHEVATDTYPSGAGPRGQAA